MRTSWRREGLSWRPCVSRVIQGAAVLATDPCAARLHGGSRSLSSDSKEGQTALGADWELIEIEVCLSATEISPIIGGES